MTNNAVTYGSNTTTTWAYFTPARWKDGTVYVKSNQPCPGHDLRVIHNFGYGEDENGRPIHACPTGFLNCVVCFGIADEPEPYECTKWRES